MRLADTLIIPPELEAVRESGDLVVFAGAGISMAPPANLPGFRELAREIAEPVVPWDESYSNAIDRYLDRAEREHIHVHERAREILSARGGQHTPLHEHLVGVFGAADRVRLITTNFDPFFSSASQAVFPSATISHYTGPALPLGREFAGVAQIHGSLSNSREGLVLTGRDFGAAYLTDGWATRFLLGVFSKRIVLFTGYRLGDPVMQYLLSALPVRGRAYALCHHVERDAWRQFGIEPITFDTAPNGDRFADLNDGVQQWRWYAQASPATHDNELRRIIALGTAITAKDEDFVRVRLGTEAGRASFYDAATMIAWFDWAAKEKLLDSFVDDTAPAEAVQPWAGWCLEHFSSGPSPALLAFIRERSLALNPVFASMLALHLWRIDPMPDQAVARQYVALIVNQKRTGRFAFDYHVWLLRKLVQHGMAEEAAALLRWLTQVHLKRGDYYHLDDVHEGKPELSALSLGIDIHASSDLAHQIDEHGAEFADLLAVQMLEIGEQRIREAYELSGLARGTADGRFDWLSFGRTAIAASNQDVGGNAEDVLVLLVREAIDRLVETDGNRILVFARMRSATGELLLLRRLALYAFARLPTLDPDWLLDRTCEERWPHDIWLRPELYEVLKAHYVRASEAVRGRLIATLQRDDWWQADDEYAGRMRFDLSQLIERIVPDDAATAAFAEYERIAHKDWSESDRDGVLSRTEIGWGGEEPSPIDLGTMLSWTAEEARVQIERTLSEEVSRRHGVEFALLGTLQAAAKASPSWATSLFEAISERAESGAVEGRIVEAIGWGIREADLSPEQEGAFLRSCASMKWPESAANAIAFAVDTWARKLPEKPTVDLLDVFDAAADVLFERSRGSEPGVGELGWFERAINHPAGHAAQVWWNVANGRNRLSGEFVLSVNDAERERWQRVLSDSTEAGRYARPILGLATERLVAGDPAWCEQTLIPAYDPAHGDSAAQLWDGRLHDARWSWQFVAAIERYWDAFLIASGTLVPSRGVQIGDVIALFVAHHSKSQFTRQRLILFIQHTTDEGRRAFASALPRHLGTITSEERTQLWHVLLAPYWRDRLTNMPRAFSADEVRAMVSWIPALSEVADEAAALLMQTDCPPLQHAGRILHEWHEDERFAREHANAAVAVVEFLSVRRSLESWDDDDAIYTLEVALAVGADRTRLIRAADALAMATRSRRATELAGRLRVDTYYLGHSLDDITQRIAPADAGRTF